MLDEFEMGMPAERIDTLFDEVQSALVPFIAKIRASENKPSLAPLSGKFNIDAQKEVSELFFYIIGTGKHMLYATVAHNKSYITYN